MCGSPIYFMDEGKAFISSDTYIIKMPPEPKIENCHAAWTSSFGNKTAVMTFELFPAVHPYTRREGELLYEGIERWGDKPPKLVITEDFEDA